MKEKRYVLSPDVDGVRRAHVVQSLGVTRCGREISWGWKRLREKTPEQSGAVPCKHCFKTNDAPGRPTIRGKVAAGVCVDEKSGFDRIVNEYRDETARAAEKLGDKMASRWFAATLERTKT